MLKQTNAQNVDINGMRFKIKNKLKKDNSHPKIKINIRKWLLNYFETPYILDIYGGNGLMFEKVWKNYNYNSYLRYIIQCLMPKMKIEKMVVQYGHGTWKQGTCYFAIILNKL